MKSYTDEEIVEIIERYFQIHPLTVKKDDVILIRMKEYNQAARRIFNRLKKDFPDNKIMAFGFENLDEIMSIQIESKEEAIKGLRNMITYLDEGVI